MTKLSLLHRTNALKYVSLLAAICTLFCSVAVVEGSIPFFDDISREAHRQVKLEYGGQHPFEWEEHKKRSRRRRSLQVKEYDKLEDASKQDVSYSTRDSSYAPIRIKFDTTLLEARLGESMQRDSVIREILEALPQASAQWAKHLYTVPVRSAITVHPDVCFGIFGSALKQTSVLEADLVIVVSGRDELIDYNGVSTFPVCGGSTLALASACDLDQYDRPIVGFMNFCLDHDSSEEIDNLQRPFGYFLNVDLNNEHIRISKKDVALHEMAHIMALSSWMYKYFRHLDGTPRTARPFNSQTIPCSPDGEKSGVLPSTNTMASSIDPASGKLVYNIVTPRVKQVTRNLLGCDAVMGARLAEGVECFGSHWHERLFLGEILSPVLTSSTENILSPLTLALMEDSGWYTVDYRDVDIPVFGLAAGCKFAAESCIQDDEVPEWGRDMFCIYPLRFGWDGRVTPASLNHVICDPSHRWWTVCDLWDAPTVPEDFEVEFPESSERYFSNENLVTSFGSADSCPIAVRSLGYDCTQRNSEYTPFYPGEQVGPESRCVIASKEIRSDIHSYRPACMATRCDSEQGKLVISLHGSTEHVCQFDGETIQLVDGSMLACPRLASVCPQLATCPGGCSGRGVCDYEAIPPVCICDEEENQNPGCFPQADRAVRTPSGAGGRASPGTEPTDESGQDGPNRGVSSSSAMSSQALGWITVTFTLSVSLLSIL